MIDLDLQLTEEEFNLYNPAYCGYLLYNFIKSHMSHSEQAMHCGLIYLILPIVLTKEILVKLPRSSKSSFISWVSDNEGALIGFPQRTQSFLEISLSAQDFLIENELIYIKEDGTIGVSNSTLPKSPSLFNKSIYMKAQLTASNLLGKWLSVSPSVETIYSVLGMRP